jgi:hypothetical protein
MAQIRNWEGGKPGWSKKKASAKAAMAGGEWTSLAILKLALETLD